MRRDAAAPDSTRLGPDHLAAFRRDGFVVMRGYFTAAEMRDITAWTDACAALPEVPGTYMMYFENSLRDGSRILNRLENFAPYHDGFRRLIDGTKLRGAAAELFGEPAILFKDKINFKMPGGDGFTPHQDQQAGWTRYAGLFITALVSVDAATPENGCLELAAGFHDKGLIGQEWAPLSPAEMAGMTFVPVTTRPGDVVFFDSFVPHRSGPNLTERARRALYLTWNRARDGDRRAAYYADKRASYPPDIEREPGRSYVFRV